MLLLALLLNLGLSPITNFGQLDSRFLRGAQPKDNQFVWLRDNGVRFVINLRENPKDKERQIVEQLGMKYFSIPMSDRKYPKPESINLFLKIIEENPGKFFIHCAGGRHRTGVIGAVYRYHYYHWTFEQVYAEMKQYDFYTRWGHGNLKQFVKDYVFLSP